jgi:hypothetical protein
MKKLIGLVLAVVLLSPAMAFAGGSTDAALGLGAFAVFNQILGGVGIFGGAPAVYAAPAPVYAPPPPVYVAPAPVYYAPPPVVYAPPVVVRQPVFVGRAAVYYRPYGYYAHAPVRVYRHW